MPKRTPTRTDVDRDGKPEYRSVPRRKNGTFAPGKRPIVKAPKKR